ncbi:hypothetical protein [Mesorhizobium sp. M0767]|uniref:hypothetical protein n=1 Tax=Mesorhizobium sp. M0767 TaxID=2956995 RepID=UPI003337F4FC
MIVAEASFEISRFSNRKSTMGQYERQLQRLRAAGKEVLAVESAVRDALRNLQKLQGRSFVIYGEPQSGKTEMMICLTAKLLDERFDS